MAIHIVGLGPGRVSLLTEEARAILTTSPRVILRTRHHPTVPEIDPDQRFGDCDDLYAGGDSFEAVYRGVVERVMEAATAGDTVYAVPGHPLVAESTVSLLVERARAASLATHIYPGISYVDLAAVALERDLSTTQLCDALDVRIDAQRPALISQVYDRDSVTALKLKLLDIYPASHTATVLSALGTADEALREVALAELDHAAFGYLDSIYLPALEAIDDVRRFDGLHAVVSRLHAPDGCPWDREQTHASLRPHLLEEAYEALEAIDSGDPDRLAEELGDVLLQVMMHAAVAERLDEFTFGDVAEHITRKLVRRHPHVFGEATARTAEDVRQSWEDLKKEEKPRSSILEGIPSTLPALAASQSIQGRARRVGFDWPNIEGPLDKLVEEVQEFARAESETDREDEFGDILFVLANVSQRLGIDAEQALRRANDKFRRRFTRVETLAAERGLDLKELDLQGLDLIWDEAKTFEQRSL
jgi:tetrapyrrole methylase family protein / MazG family protein